MEDKILSMPIVIDLGGPTSGHRGHKGVPGIRGGSAPGVGGSPSYAGLLDAVKSGTCEKVNEGSYERGIFESYKLRIPGDGDAIVKPEPKYPRVGIKKGWGTYPHSEREVAAYDLAQELGFEDLVPPTILGKHEGRTSSFQSWQEDVEDGYTIHPPELMGSDVGRMAILDFITDNRDRHLGNLLQRKDGSLVAIDHGLAFKDHRQLDLFPTGFYSFLVDHGGPTHYNLTKSEKVRFKSLFEDKDKLMDYGKRVGEKNAELVWEKLNQLSMAKALDWSTSVMDIKV